ncbi:MAG TPA: hypothetical protein VLG37_00995 [Candidatus Saccharimonadales bacterium]|nr:hypothetical protein [Candidatus Saccharimonadales bacterium]
MVEKILRWYRLGLMIVGLAALAVVILVVTQALSAKQDNETYKKANEIATKLNSYANKNQAIPDSLAAAGIKDVPSTITYKKKASDSYEFCVTYKSADNSMNTVGISDVLMGARFGMPPMTSGSYGSYGSSSLYISTQHKKGQNCQTVTPYFYSSSSGYNGYNYGSGSNCRYDYTKSGSQAYQDYLNCLDKASSQQPTTLTN